MSKKAVATPVARLVELDEIEAMEKEDRNRLFEGARKVVLAAVGAAALAQDELEDFVTRLMERGEIAEKDARKLLKEVTEKRRKNVVKDFDKRMEAVLNRMDVPSKADIDSLSEKIALLTEKIDAMKK